MFTFIWTLILTTAWSILCFLITQHWRKKYEALDRHFSSLYKHCLELNNQAKECRKAKNENAELKAENRELKTRLKEQAIGEIRGKKGD